MLLKIPYLFIPALVHCLRGLVLILAVCLLLLPGCSSETKDSSEVLDESWFTLDEDGESDAAASQAESRARLGVNLQQGDRFPLRKVVEKVLTQKSIQGSTQNREYIELDMAVTVEEIRDQKKRFSVRYNRVQYESDLTGQMVRYDSEQPALNVPDSVLVYQGMVDNGFSFWVGPDNKITDVVDFQQFVQKCLAQVPSDQADRTARILAQYSGQDGIANFVDDTIGLLPYDPNSPDGSAVVRLGGNWTKSRHYNEPVPMSLKNTYTLRDLNQEYAKVEILGDVAPASATSGTGSAQISLQVRDGHSIGSCTIDRKTGLPLESRIDHLLNMTVQAGALQFEQQKRVVTSIRMFPDQNAGQMPGSATAQQSPSQPSTIQQASFEELVQ